MASPPSSDHRGTSTDSPVVTFPPRAQLPPGIIVEKIPWIGTSWYDRGLAYWVRRVGGTLFALAVLALYTGILILFLHGVYDSSGRHAWFYGLLGFEIIFSLVSGSLMLVRLIKRPAKFPPDPAEERRWARLRPRAGKVIIFGMLLGDAFLVLIAALSYGMWLAFLLRTFIPVLPTERQARQRMAVRLSEYAGRTADP